MNNVHRLFMLAVAWVFFLLGMTIAYYNQFTADPQEHFAIHSRALNYTDKDCYTKSDVELIVFGKILDND
tara:strand:+ start:227 stop:436 length:210 start_codon:yes stop_codon:yes gene_type:complete